MSQDENRKQNGLRRSFEYSTGKGGVITYDVGTLPEEMDPQAAYVAKDQGAFGEQVEVARPYYQDAGLTDIQHVNDSLNEQNKAPANFHGANQGAAITGPVENANYPNPVISGPDSAEPVQQSMPGVAQGAAIDTRQPAVPTGLVTPYDDEERASAFGKPGFRQNELSVTEGMEPAVAVMDVENPAVDPNDVNAKDGAIGIDAEASRPQPPVQTPDAEDRVARPVAFADPDSREAAEYNKVAGNSTDAAIDAGKDPAPVNKTGAASKTTETKTDDKTVNDLDGTIGRDAEASKPQAPVETPAVQHDSSFAEFSKNAETEIATDAPASTNKDATVAASEQNPTADVNTNQVQSKAKDATPAAGAGKIKLK